MTPAKKQSETATLLRAGRTKGTAHNKAAAAVVADSGEKTRQRVMINVPRDMLPDVKAAAKEMGVSMATYFVLAAKEKLTAG